MATPATAPGGTFSFTKDGTFLDNQIDASITVTANAAAAAILVANQAFPAGKTVIGTLSASINGSSSDLKFASGQGSVTFSGSAAAISALAVYDDTSALFSDLDPGNLLEGITLDAPDSKQFVLLDWGYNLSATVQGSVALGAAAGATFAFDGSSDGLFAVIRGFAEPPKSVAAIQSTVDAWMLPRQITGVDSLAPGSWLIAEIDGTFGIKLGAQYGYNFNWVRNVNLGGLSGDVGLKIQAAVDAAIGFDASGKYLIMVARESTDPASKVVRVRLFKMAKKGWNFAFNASVGVTGSTGSLLPDQLDDFIAAVFGVHGAQIVEDLKEFDKWTDPSTPLPDLLAGFVSDYVTKELSTFAGPEIAKFQEARNRVADFLSKWDNLGHTTSTMLWAAVKKGGGPLAALLNFLNQSNGLSDDALKALIETELGKVGFLSGAVGKFLESVTANNVLTLLNSSGLLPPVRSAVKDVLDILNGKVLDDLVQYVDQKLHIPDVEKMVNEADFNNLDPLLKAKLAKFLGQQKLLFADLEKIRAAAKAVRDKASDLYQQALSALNHTYTAAMHVTYAKTTASTALMDVSFDFVKDPSVGAFMKMAIQGDFKDLLLAASPAITINQATLTHGVTRQSHVQIVLPYFNDTIDHINTSLATMNVVQDKGRLFVYDLHADDQVIQAHKWSSDLTITGKLTSAAGVRTFVTDAEVADSMTFDYSLRQASKGARDVQLEDQLRPLVDPYFSKAFGGPSAPNKASLHEWIGDLDVFATALNKTGTGNLGDVLLSLEVSLPGKVVAAWLNCPADKRDPAYLKMSLNLQEAIRRFAQFSYFNDPARYHDLNSAPAVFVYGCMPLSTNVKEHPDGSITLNDAGDVYWNCADPHLLAKMAFEPASDGVLIQRLRGIQDVLQDSVKFKGDAGFYDPRFVRTPKDPRNAALQDHRFMDFFLNESQIINEVRNAGVRLAQFQAKAGTDPQQAINALSDFGAKVTDAFSHKLGTSFGRLQEFSAMIFLNAACAFDPGLAGVQPVARLDTFLLKPSAPATVIDDFLNGTAPDPTVVTLEQPVVGV